MKQADVHKANIDEHNIYAPLHDFNVGYIRNKNNREYYYSIILNEIKHKLNNKQQIDVLEIGCATGTFCNFFLNNGVNSYTGIDISDQMIAIAKNKFKQANVNFFKSPIEEIDSEMKYDIIISSSFLHHMYDLDFVVNKINELLKNNGIYIAMHEPKTILKASKFDILINLLDQIYAVWFGYDGWYGKSFADKIKNSINILMSPIKKRLNCKRVETSSEINLVDFQLNSDFEENLLEAIDCLNAKQQVYTYYHNYYFTKVSNLNNYFYIVLEKR